MKEWHETLSSNDFKNLASARIDMLNDPTLKQDYLEEIFSQFGLLVLSINVSFAEEYYKKGDKSNFGRHINIIKESDFDIFTKDEALSGIFDSLYNSVNEKFEEFDNIDFKSKSDIPKIESFLVSIDSNLSLLSEYFSDNDQFQLLSDKIAESVKIKYVEIVNNEGSNSDSSLDLDFDKIEMVFNSLMAMAYTPTVKDNISENLKQLESLKKSKDLEKFANKINRLNENIPLHEAQKLIKEIEIELKTLDSDDSASISDYFAISIHNFVVTKVNNIQDNYKSFNNSKPYLLDLLKTALNYANEDKTIETIENSLEQLEEMNPDASYELQQRIVSFMDDIESHSISYATSYATEVSKELKNLNPENKNDISDAFALSLKNFVIAQVNSNNVVGSKYKLIRLLEIANDRAVDEELAYNIQEDMEFIDIYPDEMKLREIYDKISEFMKKINDSIGLVSYDDVTKYIDGIADDLDSNKSPNRYDVSDALASSITSYVVLKVNSCGSELGRVLINFYNYVSLLRIAMKYAREESTLNHTFETLFSLVQMKSAAEGKDIYSDDTANKLIMEFRDLSDETKKTIAKIEREKSRREVKKDKELSEAKKAKKSREAREAKEAKKAKKFRKTEKSKPVGSKQSENTEIQSTGGRGFGKTALILVIILVIIAGLLHYCGII